MLLKIAITLAVILVMFVLFVHRKPPQFRIARAITIAAPPEVLFPHVNNLQAMAVWSPFEKKDPNLKRTVSGPAEGVGAMYGWSGNNQVGEGKITIEKSDPPRRIEMRLEFIRPFKAVNRGIFTFEPIGEETRVTWAMEGVNNFMFKTIGMFMNMDRTVGTEFAKGLAELKEIAEREVGAH